MTWLRRRFQDVRWLAGFVWRDRELRADLFRAVVFAAAVIVAVVLFSGCGTVRPVPEAQYIREVHPVRPAPARNAPVVEPTEATLIWRNAEGEVDVHR